jgi:hypothetical protein
LESELGNDAVDGSFADGEVTLSEFLSDDFGAGFRIQEAVADNLTDKFLGAPVVGMGASFGAEQSGASFLKKKSPKLEVPLAAKTEFSGGTVNAYRAAFALDEHGQFTSDLIVWGDGQGAELALNPLLEKFERNHANLRGGATISLLKYGTHCQGKQGTIENISVTIKRFLWGRGWRGRYIVPYLIRQLHGIETVGSAGSRVAGLIICPSEIAAERAT